MSAVGQMSRRGEPNLRNQGERHGLAKLREFEARAIRASRERAKILARRFGVAPDTVYQIRSGRIWRHLA